jgi:hypothetical protein
MKDEENILDPGRKTSILNQSGRRGQLVNLDPARSFLLKRLRDFGDNLAIDLDWYCRRRAYGTS